MRVLHVLAPGAVGGLERVAQLLAVGQARSGDEVHAAPVLDPATENHPFVEQLATGGVAVHPVVVPGRQYWRERTAVARLGHRLRPDVVHTHGYRPDLVDAGAVSRLGIPVVTTVHGFCGGGWKNRLYERLQRRAYRRFDAVVVVSRPLVDQLIRDGVSPQRIHFVQNAWRETTPPLDRVTARSALGLREAGFVIGWVGRLSGEKGPDVLLNALPHLTDLPITVSMVGDGPERSALASRAGDFAIERRLRLHGMIRDAGRLFAAFDVFVMSSHTEGTPIVLFEAMAAGVPIVASQVGGVPDVVSSADAVLVPPADPVVLAEAIRVVYCDHAAARIRAQRARERLLKEFTVAPWISRYDAIYRLVTNKARAAVTV